MILSLQDRPDGTNRNAGGGLASDPVGCICGHGNQIGVERSLRLIIPVAAAPAFTTLSGFGQTTVQVIQT